jgi:hypothetical protein
MYPTAMHEMHMPVAAKVRLLRFILFFSFSYPCMYPTGMHGTHVILCQRAQGAGDGQFSNPMGIALDADHVHVADWSNHRVQVRRGVHNCVGPRTEWGGGRRWLEEGEWETRAGSCCLLDTLLWWPCVNWCDARSPMSENKLVTVGRLARYAV